MNLRQRIITDGERFYPQERGLFGWRFCKEPGYPQMDGLDVGDQIISFPTKDGAEAYLKPTEWKVV